MKKTAISVILAAIGCIASNAMAEESPWLVRLRAAHINPADKADPISGAGKADRITVSSKTIPEVDISYFFTPNLAAELVLTYPQKHHVYLDGADIGTFKHLPPTLSLQYHFTPASSFSPYVGAGINYTNISSVSLAGGAGALEHSSVGLSYGAGFDLKLDKQWSLNVDLKNIQIGSDVKLSGVKVSNVKIDPWLFSIGVGYRF